MPGSQVVISQISTKIRNNESGFSLIEIVVALAISGIATLVTVNLFRSFLISSAKLAGSQALTSESERAISYLDLELSQALRLTTDVNSITMPENCNIEDDEFRLALYGKSGALPTIFAVKTSPDGWLGDDSLWRCGPSFDQFGNPINNTSELSILLDGLDGSGSPPDNGFKVNSLDTNFKSIDFTLKLKGNTPSKTITFYGQSFAKITPFYSLPDRLSNACDLATLPREKLDLSDTAYAGFVVDANKPDQVICAFGGVLNQTYPSITGGENNDIIEIVDEGIVTLYGADGNDTLRGNIEANRLEGNSGNDTLIGREGADTLIGGDGSNEFLPGSGADKVIGNSNNLQIVYFENAYADYTITNCNQLTCFVQKNIDNNTSETNTLCYVNVIIFPDKRYDVSTPSSGDTASEDCTS